MQVTREQVVQWANEAEKMANAACKEMPGMEYRAAEAFALITLARAGLEAELESLRKDAERLNYLTENHVYRLCGEDIWIAGISCGSTPYLREAIDAAISAPQKEVA